MKARENPFRVERLHALRYRFLSGQMQLVLHRLEKQDFRGAIVGPHGSGKTTLLAELSAALVQQGQTIKEIRLNEANLPEHQALIWDGVDHLPDQTILVIDGAEQLSLRSWKKFEENSHRFRGLVVTTHRPGRLSTIHTCRTNVSLLSDLVEELTGTDHSINTVQLTKLYKKHRGNLRDILRELYDRKN